MAFAGRLMTSALTRQQVETLAGFLTVGETYFFREQKSFEVVRQEVLPEIIRARQGRDQRLRIWSAGCCTGEEPYSIAMMVREVLPDPGSWNITILGTDINPRFLEKASEAVYGEWSLRDTSERLREKFFVRTAGGSHQVAPEVRSMVTLQYLNLAEDVYPSLLNGTNAMDVIFCRNVLMYFAPEQAKRVITSLHHTLLDGGWLLVSPSEFTHVHGSGFVAVSFPGAILYRKAPPGRETERGASHPDAAGKSPVPTDAHTPASAKAPARKPPPVRRTAYEDALHHYEQGCYAEAVEELTALLAHEAEPHAMALLARAYADQGKLPDALAACDRAVSRDKLCAAYHYLRATILHEQVAHEEAKASLKRALYLDPRFVVAHFTLANLAHAQGDMAEARRHFTNASLLLRDFHPEDALPESDGLTAGRLAAIIATMMQEEAPT